MFGAHGIHRARARTALDHSSATRLPQGRIGRVLVAGIGGTVAIVVGLGLLVPRALLGGSASAGITGLVVTVAGLVMLGLAFWEALSGRSWHVKLLALPVLVVLLQWVSVPAVNAGLVTNAPHDHSPDATTLGLPGAREVSFHARDGVLLRGWFAPGRSRAQRPAIPTEEAFRSPLPSE
jgi:hypothetical protein